MMKRCMGCMAQLEEQVKICPHCGYREDTPVAEAYYLAPGTMLHGRYLLGKVLGYGGFGVTYIAWDTLLRKTAAIKEYFPSDFATRGTGSTKVTIYSGDAFEQFRSGLESFISEAKRLAQLNRIKSIVHIYDYVLENDTGYIVMEYLSGKTVKEDLRSRGRYGWEEARRILVCVLEALEEVHKLGIIHRDVAPDNIFLTDDGQIKLIDFGAARSAASSKSRSLSVILKPGYAPEEQYRSRGKQGPWTDVYGAGATLYRMLTGQKPEDSLERMVEDELQPPSALGVSLPRQMEAALMKSLAIRGEDRYQSARDFREALMRAEPSGKETAVSGEEPQTQAGISGKETAAFGKKSQTPTDMSGKEALTGRPERGGGAGGTPEVRHDKKDSRIKEEADGGEIGSKTWDAEDDSRARKTGKGTGGRTGRLLFVAAILAVGLFALLLGRAGLRKNGQEDDLVAESETASDTEKAEPETESESESETETARETEPESGTETESETESESESEAETESETEPESESETETVSETESESETETVSETESESESKTETENETEAASEEPDKTVELVASETVNVRSEPSMESDDTIIGGLYQGDSVTMIGETDDGWTMIDYHGETGYVLTEYLSKPEETETTAETETELQTETETSGESTELGTDIYSGRFALNGKVFQMPVRGADLEESGFILNTEFKLSELNAGVLNDGKVSGGGQIVVLVEAEEQSVGYAVLENPGAEDADISDCVLIYLEDSDENLELPGQIQTGSTMDELLEGFLELADAETGKSNSDEGGWAESYMAQHLGEELYVYHFSGSKVFEDKYYNAYIYMDAKQISVIEITISLE